MDNALIQTSGFLQSVRRGGQAIIWHSIFGNPKIVPESTLSFLESLRTPACLNDLGLDEDDRTVVEGLTAGNDQVRLTNGGAIVRS